MDIRSKRPWDMCVSHFLQSSLFDNTLISFNPENFHRVARADDAGVVLDGRGFPRGRRQSVALFEFADALPREAQDLVRIVKDP